VLKKNGGLAVTVQQEALGALSNHVREQTGTLQGDKMAVSNMAQKVVSNFGEMANAGSLVEEGNGNMLFEEEQKMGESVLQRAPGHLPQREFDDDDLTPSRKMDRMR
jgi:hypothetical protein